MPFFRSPRHSVKDDPCPGLWSGWGRVLSIALWAGAALQFGAVFAVPHVFVRTLLLTVLALATAWCAWRLWRRLSPALLGAVVVVTGLDAVLTAVLLSTTGDYATGLGRAIGDAAGAAPDARHVPLLITVLGADLLLAAVCAILFPRVRSRHRAHEWRTAAGLARSRQPMGRAELRNRMS